MLRNRLVLLAVIILTGIFASFYGGNVSYALFYLALFTPVMCFLYTLYVYVRLKMYQSIGKKTIVKGEVTEFNFQVANEDVISYQNVKIDFYHDKSRILGTDIVREYSLLPGEKQSMDTLICCNYMGEYYIGAKTVTITDFLYLFSITYSVLSKMKVWVLPRVVSLPNLNVISVNSDPKRNIRHLREEEEEMDTEVRKYVNGDNKKLIHWKATARKQEFMTRKYTSIPKNGVSLFMDLSVIDGDELTNVIVKDKIMEGTLAIVDYCKRRRIPCDINYEKRPSGFEQIPIRDQGDFDAFYNNCIYLPFSSVKTIDEIVLEGEKGRFRGISNQYVIITHKITNGLYKLIPTIMGSGNECSIIFISQNMNEETNYLLKLIMEAGANVLTISQNDEITDVL